MTRYVYAEWRMRRAGLDYHVEVDRHYYSVPWRFAREQIEARIGTHLNVRPASACAGGNA